MSSQLLVYLKGSGTDCQLRVLARGDRRLTAPEAAGGQHPGPRLVHRDTIAEHLIRRDPRAYALPAHTPVDLLEYCSVMRNNHRCYAALCGQNPASLA
jgi:hypothetical protein